MDPSVAAGALQTILVALQNDVSTVLEDMNDNKFWDAAGANNGCCLIIRLVRAVEDGSIIFSGSMKGRGLKD